MSYGFVLRNGAKVLCSIGLGDCVEYAKHVVNTKYSGKLYLCNNCFRAYHKLFGENDNVKENKT